MRGDRLALVGLTSNKNPIPFDSARPSEWSGLRLGVAAATTRGLRETEFNTLGEIIGGLILRDDADDAGFITECRNRVASLCAEFPIYV